MNKYYINKQDLLDNDAFGCKLSKTPSENHDDVILYFEARNWSDIASDRDEEIMKRYGHVEMVYQNKTILDAEGGIYIAEPDISEDSPLQFIWLYPDQLHYVKNKIELLEINKQIFDFQNHGTRLKNLIHTALYKQRIAIKNEITKYHIIHEV